MPIYEFRCNACGQRASLFFRSFATPVAPVCPQCTSTDMQRLMSRPNLLKTADQRLSKLDEYERYMGELDNPHDPAAIARWARRVGQDLDADLDTDFREKAAQISGEDRPYDLYDPRGTLELALERKRRELLGWQEPPDPWAQTMAEASSQGEPQFVKEARERGALPDGSPFPG
ncbi:MAG: zinc ribbon domain-containing protein [Chloroflexi bacterium]|nr:zinc ribbon domain-containing protein [Chloroflexota bacterium]